MDDPYILTEIFNRGASASDNSCGNANANGRTQVSAAIASGEKTLVLLIAGQSNSANYCGSPYTPTNAKVENLSIYDGGVYRAKDPLLGAGNFYAGNFSTRLGDKLISAATAARVILVPIGLGGTTVSQWAPGGSLNHRLVVACKRLSSNGLTPSAVLWHQGESDRQAGTAKAAYKASLASVISTVRGLGFSAPWFIAQASYQGGLTSTTITDAQAEMVDHANAIWAGPNTDSLGSPYRMTDNTHFNDSGADTVASGFQSSLAASGAPF